MSYRNQCLLKFLPITAISKDSEIRKHEGIRTIQESNLNEIL